MRYMRVMASKTCENVDEKREEKRVYVSFTVSPPMVHHGSITFHHPQCIRQTAHPHIVLIRVV